MIVMLVVEDHVYAHYAWMTDGEIRVEQISCDAPAQAVREMIAMYNCIPTTKQVGCRRRGQGRRPRRSRKKSIISLNAELRRSRS